MGVIVPKEMSGWGLKNIHLFGRALATKCVWRFIFGKWISCQAVTQKYIELDTVEC